MPELKTSLRLVMITAQLLPLTKCCSNEQYLKYSPSLQILPSVVSAPF